MYVDEKWQPRAAAAGFAAVSDQVANRNVPEMGPGPPKGAGTETLPSPRTGSEPAPQRTIGAQPRGPAS